MQVEFVTSNPVKLRIANEVLKKYGISLRQRKLELLELQSFDGEEVARDKARQAMKGAKNPFIISDDGFYIDALGGFPGALLKHVRSKINEEKLLGLLKGEKSRSAKFVNIIVFGDPKSKSYRVFTTITKGRLSKKPMGYRTIGWSIERIFIPEGKGKTIAQFNNKEWEKFWESYKDRLHYTKLGSWIKKMRS